MQPLYPTSTYGFPTPNNQYAPGYAPGLVSHTIPVAGFKPQQVIAPQFAGSANGAQTTNKFAAFWQRVLGWFPKSTRGKQPADATKLAANVNQANAHSRQAALTEALGSLLLSDKPMYKLSPKQQQAFTREANVNFVKLIMSLESFTSADQTTIESFIDCNRRENKLPNLYPLPSFLMETRLRLDNKHFRLADWLQKDVTGLTLAQIEKLLNIPTQVDHAHTRFYAKLFNLREIFPILSLNAKPNTWENGMLESYERDNSEAPTKTTIRQEKAKIVFMTDLHWITQTAYNSLPEKEYGFLCTAIQNLIATNSPGIPGSLKSELQQLTQQAFDLVKQTAKKQNVVALVPTSQRATDVAQINFALERVDAPQVDSTSLAVAPKPAPLAIKPPEAPKTAASSASASSSSATGGSSNFFQEVAEIIQQLVQETIQKNSIAGAETSGNLNYILNFNPADATQANITNLMGAAIALNIPGLKDQIIERIKGASATASSTDTSSTASSTALVRVSRGDVIALLKQKQQH